MKAFIATLFKYRAIVLILFIGSLAVGVYAFLQLDIEAYPDPSPPLVKILHGPQRRWSNRSQCPWKLR